MDRTAWLIVGVGIAYVLLRRSGQVAPGVDPNIRFGPVTAGDAPAPWYGNWCYANDPWGGWSDNSKIEEATKYYVAIWGFDPPDEFKRYIAKMEPCRPEAITPELLQKFPPFPGQTLKASQLAKIARQQAAFRAIKAQSEAESKASCQSAARAIGGVAGAAGGAVLLATGVGAPAAAGAGAAGQGLGALVGSFC